MFRGLASLLFSAILSGCFSNATMQVTDISAKDSSTSSEKSSGPFIYVNVTTAPNIISATSASYTISGTCSNEGESVNVSATSGPTISLPAATCTAGAWSIGPVSLAALTGSSVIFDLTHSTATNSITRPRDVVSPSVVNVHSTTANGSYNEGTVIPIHVTFSEVVNVTGTPRLLTNSSGSYVDYTSGSGTITLTFSYTVGSGDSSADLNQSGALDLNAATATIMDSAGNGANLSTPATMAAGSLDTNANIIIDTLDPTGTINITSTLNNVAAISTSAIALTLTQSEAAEMFLSENNPTCAVPTWSVFSNTPTYNLTGGHGKYQLYAQYKDAAGNISPCYSTGAFYYEPVSVTPFYPVNGVNWNALISMAGGIWGSTDTLCNSAGTLAKSCFHGGEIRRVLTDFTTCAGLSISDNLSLFAWSNCQLIAGKAEFWSSGLQGSASLSSLIDSSSGKWKDLSVTVADVGTPYTSVARPWWNNPVTALPDNSQALDTATTLDVASTIYYLSSSRRTHGYNINADRIGVVVMPGAKLYYGGKSAFNTNASNGSNVAPNTRAILSSGSKKFLWIEGNFDGKFDGVTDVTTADYGLLVASAKYSTFKHISVSNTLSSSMYFTGGGSHTFDDVSVANNFGFTALDLFSCHGNTMMFARAFNNHGNGIKLESSDNNALSFTMSTNNGGSGSGDGVVLKNSSNNVLTATTVANVDQRGIVIDGSGGSASGNIIHNAAVLNSNSITVLGNLGPATNTTFAQVASVHNTQSFFSNSATGTKVTGNLLTPAVPSCVIAGGTNANNGFDGTCAAYGASNHAVIIAGTISSDFVGKATSDTQNASSGFAAGMAPYSENFNDMDWFSFDKVFRAWGLDGGAFPISTNRGFCNSGNCRVWDYTLTSTATTIRNTTDDGINPNAPFTGGSPCPAHLMGSVILSNSGASKTFLKNAIEVISASNGNGDGLCESNETCIYTPNFGAYQGHGSPFSNSCTFTSGTLVGISLYAYPLNGF